MAIPLKDEVYLHIKLIRKPFIYERSKKNVEKYTYKGATVTDE